MEVRDYGAWYSELKTTAKSPFSRYREIKSPNLNTFTVVAKFGPLGQN